MALGSFVRMKAIDTRAWPTVVVHPESGIGTIRMVDDPGRSVCLRYTLTPDVAVNLINSLAAYLRAVRE